MTEAATAPIGVFVLDDHPLVRRSLRELLGATPDLILVGEAASAQEALAKPAIAQTDIAQTDIVLAVIVLRTGAASMCAVR